MRAHSRIALGCSLLMVACTPQPTPPTSPTRQPVSASGRDTRLGPTNAPEVVPLAPEVVVPGAPFEPLGEAGAAMAHVVSYTTDNGLPMDDIACMTKDHLGMLWIGTNGGGLTRYDGRSFVTYTTTHGLPDNTIMSLHCDRRGHLWIGTSVGGLCRYDGHRFTTYTIGNATGLSKGITAMAEDTSGTVWFGSRGHGVYRYDGKDFTIMPVLHPEGKDIVRDVLLSPDGALWVSTYDGLARSDGQGFERVVDPAGDALADVVAMTADDRGSLWLGRAQGGITRCAPAARGWSFTHAPLIAGKAVRAGRLIQAEGGGIWVGSRTHGVMHFDPQNLDLQVTEHMNAMNGLPTDVVECVVTDQGGDLWIGTRGAGIAHYRGPAFTYFRGFKPIGIAEDPKGVLWVGTDHGIARFDGERFSQQRAGSDDVGWNYAVSIDPQGRMGFGHNMADPQRHGISWFDGRDYHVTSAPDDRTWMDIFWTMHDRRGRLWAGGRRGAERYADGQRTSFTTAQGLGSNLVLCMREDRHGRIWVGTDGGGISCIDSATVTTWTMREGLPNNVVWSITEEPGGTLWLGTLAGLCRFDGRSFLTYGTADGLPNENLSTVAIARDGRALFAGTLNGLAVLEAWSNPALENPMGDRIAFGALDGLPNDSILAYAPVFTVHNTATGAPVRDVQTAERSIFEDGRGVLWISTGSDKSGLVRFDPKAVRPCTAAVEPRLVSVQLNNEPVCWHGLGGQPVDSATLVQAEQMSLGAARTPEQRARDHERYAGLSFSGITPFLSVPQDLVLDHAHNRIGFSFIGVETARPELVAYSTHLEGYEADWSPPARATSMSYGNIHEGSYTFRVKTRNAAGVWSEPLVYRFTVRPPLHRTWWAYALYLIGAAGSILFLIRRRTAALRTQKDKLERTVTERTEELRRKKEEADEQRARAELSEKAKERFLANMSHEIRTPMNAIMGMSDILKHRDHLPEQDKYLSAIHQSSENLLVIINDILDLTKIDSGRIDFEAVPFDPRAVIGNVRDILQFKAHEKGIALGMEFSPDVPATLIGDPTRLNQIVMNLAGNAIKFTEQGSVRIRVHRIVDPPGRNDRVALVIDVIDTGIGIPEDRIDHIFEEFTQAYSDTTRKYGGTGLGLTISRKLAEQQGGSVSVKSERGKGSTFTVNVPYAPLGEREP